MGFWQNVENEREYQGLSRKELAQKAEITYASIGIGLERNSIPAADAALRVAAALKVPLESLVFGSESEKFSSAENSSTNGTTLPSEKKLSAYYGTIRQLDAMPEDVRRSIMKMIETVAKN